MTSITKEPVESHDLQSAEVIKRLKLTDFVLIDEIASRLYAKILQVIESEIPTINDWSKRDEKLKGMLRTQVELLGPLYECEEMVDRLIVAEEEKIGSLLRDLIYEFHFLSLDLSALFYDFGYSTWNLLDFLDPNHYFSVRDMPASVLDMFADVLRFTPSKPPASLNKFCERLIAKGIDGRIIEAAEVSLAEWLQEVQKYRQVIISFYEAEAGAETLYAFHYSMSIAVHLLSISLSMRLLLQPITNQIN